MVALSISFTICGFAVFFGLIYLGVSLYNRDTLVKERYRLYQTKVLPNAKTVPYKYKDLLKINYTNFKGFKFKRWHRYTSIPNDKDDICYYLTYNNYVIEFNFHDYMRFNRDIENRIKRNEETKKQAINRENTEAFLKALLDEIKQEQEKAQDMIKEGKDGIENVLLWIHH